MVKEVDLLSYWMPFLRKIRELREIAKAEEPELRYLLEDRERVLDNLFIETADEYGIRRFESMMGIVPNESDALEVRRLRVLSKWANDSLYTEPVLYRTLLSICGSEDAFEIVDRYKEYILELHTQLEAAGAFDMLLEILDEMLPCNLQLLCDNKVSVSPPLSAHFGGIGCTSEKIKTTYSLKLSRPLCCTMREGVAVRVCEHIKV